MLKPQIWFEKRGGHDGLPLEFLAHIDTGHSDHHGSGDTMALAMLNATTHWFQYERKAPDDLRGAVDTISGK